MLADGSRQLCADEHPFWRRRQEICCFCSSVALFQMPLQSNTKKLPRWQHSCLQRSELSSPGVYISTPCAPYTRRFLDFRSHWNIARPLTAQRVIILCQNTLGNVLSTSLLRPAASSLAQACQRLWIHAPADRITSFWETDQAARVSLQIASFTSIVPCVSVGHHHHRQGLPSDHTCGLRTRCKSSPASLVRSN
jgi:hypothetical protein